MWCSLTYDCVPGEVYGVVVKGVEPDGTLGVTVEAMVSKETADRGICDRKIERKRTKAVTTIILWLLVLNIQPTLAHRF